MKRLEIRGARGRIGVAEMEKESAALFKEGQKRRRICKPRKAPDTNQQKGQSVTFNVLMSPIRDIHQ